MLHKRIDQQPCFKGLSGEESRKASARSQEREVGVPHSNQRSGVFAFSIRHQVDRVFTWISEGFDFYVGLVLLSQELRLFYSTFLAPNTIIFWYQLIRFQSQPWSGVSWHYLLSCMTMFLIVLVNIAVLGIIYYWFKSAVMRVVVRRRHSHLHQLSVYLRAKRDVAYLEVLARFENERRRFLRRGRHPKAGSGVYDPFAAFSPQTTIEPVGPFSWLYLWLSHYLFPPSSPVEAGPQEMEGTRIQDQQVVEGSVVQPENGHTADRSAKVAVEASMQELLAITPAKPEAAQPCVCLSFFNDLTVQIEGQKGTPLGIKDRRQQELLVYLAMQAREKPVHWGDIVRDVYKWRYRKENKEQLHEKLLKDARDLRQFFEAELHQAGLPYIDPIVVKGRGKQATWHLADAYKVKDLTELEEISLQAREATKKEKSIDLEQFRRTVEQVVESYNEGFLALLLKKKEIGPWANTYYHRYRNLYRQLLGDAADFEYTACQREQPEDQFGCLRRVARLYERYAFFCISTEGHIHTGEGALQRGIETYHLAGEDWTARHMYNRYIDRMKQRSPGWTPSRQTQKMLEEILGGKHEA
jgi:hypothetical protein